MANAVVAGLQKLLQLVLGLIATWLHVNKLVKKIGEWIAQFVCWIREKINAFLDWLLGRCGACRKAKAKKMMMGKMACGTCFVRDTLVWTSTGPRWICDIELGCLVVTFREAEHMGPRSAACQEEDEAKLRLVELVLHKEDGNQVVVRLLRDIEWVKRAHVQVGAVLWLDRHEIGAVGLHRVTAVAASPRLPSGPGSRVTATFRHHAGVVLDLSVEGEGKAIGVTPTHLVWSTDRQQWVSVGEMRVGERMAASNGSTPCVLSLKQREHPEEVCNIEVNGDHVYRVGEQGLLVHNASAPTTAPAPCCPPPVTSPSSATLGTNLGSGPNADVNPTTVSNQPQAHHIVAGSAPAAAGSRMILYAPPVCIGINDAINGVWLPQTSGPNAPTLPASTNPLGRVFHNQTFTPSYHMYVFNLLNPVQGNKTAVEGVLKMIRQGLIAGTVSW